MSEEFASYLKCLSIKLTHSSKYNPRGNGQNERYNGVIKKLIDRILKENHMESLDWELFLPEALFIQRSIVCETTGCTPHDRFLNYKRRILNTALSNRILMLPIRGQFVHGQADL